MKTIYESKSNEINNKSNLLTVVSLFFIFYYSLLSMMDYEIRFQKLFPIVISKRYVYFYWWAILLLCDKENAINQKAIFLLIPLIMICTYSLITTLLVNQNDVYVRNLTTGGGLGFWMKALGTIFFFFIIYIYINNFHLSKVINSYIYFFILLFIVDNYYNFLFFHHIIIVSPQGTGMEDYQLAILHKMYLY